MSLLASVSTFDVLTGLTTGFLWSVMLSYGLGGIEWPHSVQLQKDVRSFPPCVWFPSISMVSHIHMIAMDFVAAEKETHQHMGI